MLAAVVVAAVIAVTTAQVFDTAVLTVVGSGAGGMCAAVIWVLKRAGSEFRDIKSGIASLDARLTVIEKELHPNGGTSLADRLEAIAAIVGAPPPPLKPDNGMRRRATDRRDK